MNVLDIGGLIAHNVYDKQDGLSTQQIRNIVTIYFDQQDTTDAELAFFCPSTRNIITHENIMQSIEDHVSFYIDAGDCSGLIKILYNVTTQDWTYDGFDV